MIVKQYVSVTAKFDPDGNILPLCINWKDGRHFDIDRVTDIRYAASPLSRASGIRYTCKIKNREKFIFLEENRWFMDNN